MPIANDPKYAVAVDNVRNKGALAFKRGQSIESCPYTNPTKQGRKFRRLWLEGYEEAAFKAKVNEVMQ